MSVRYLKRIKKGKGRKIKNCKKNIKENIEKLEKKLIDELVHGFNSV